MTWALFRVMALSVVRDRGALVLAFVVPALFFVIFAYIFTGRGGAEAHFTLALFEERPATTPVPVREGLASRFDVAMQGSEAAVAARVRSGSADVGLVIRAAAAPGSSAPFVLLTDPVREPAADALAGALTELYVAAVLESLGADGEFRAGPLFERRPVAGRSAELDSVAYYAGAVAVMFLLFSAVNGAITMFDERESGLVDRILAGPAHPGVLVNGKFLYLVVQGFVQAAIIFAVAWLGYGVELPSRLPAWGMTTLGASAAAAGLSLALVTACGTRRQAQTVANVVVLIASAIGGSMVPRFLMPQLLQDLGWITPNTWAVEAYTAIFWRDEPASTLVLPWTLLFAAGLGAVLVAHRLVRRGAAD